MQYGISRCVYFCFVSFAVYESPLWLTLGQGTIDTLSDYHLHAKLHSAYNYNSRCLFSRRWVKEIDVETSALQAQPRVKSALRLRAYQSRLKL